MGISPGASSVDLSKVLLPSSDIVMSPIARELGRLLVRARRLYVKTRHLDAGSDECTDRIFAILQRIAQKALPSPDASDLIQIGCDDNTEIKGTEIGLRHETLGRHLRFNETMISAIQAGLDICEQEDDWEAASFLKAHLRETQRRSCILFAAARAEKPMFDRAFPDA